AAVELQRLYRGMMVRRVWLPKLAEANRRRACLTSFRERVLGKQVTSIKRRWRRHLEWREKNLHGRRKLRGMLAEIGCGHLYRVCGMEPEDPVQRGILGRACQVAMLTEGTRPSALPTLRELTMLLQFVKEFGKSRRQLRKELVSKWRKTITGRAQARQLEAQSSGKEWLNGYRERQQLLQRLSEMIRNADDEETKKKLVRMHTHHRLEQIEEQRRREEEMESYLMWRAEMCQHASEHQLKVKHAEAEDRERNLMRWEEVRQRRKQVIDSVVQLRKDELSKEEVALRAKFPDRFASPATEGSTPSSACEGYLMVKKGLEAHLKGGTVTVDVLLRRTEACNLAYDAISKLKEAEEELLCCRKRWHHCRSKSQRDRARYLELRSAQKKLKCKTRTERKRFGTKVTNSEARALSAQQDAKEALASAKLAVISRTKAVATVCGMEPPAALMKRWSQAKTYHQALARSIDGWCRAEARRFRKRHHFDLVLRLQRAAELAGQPREHYCSAALAHQTATGDLTSLAAVLHFEADLRVVQHGKKRQTVSIPLAPWMGVGLASELQWGWKEGHEACDWKGLGAAAFNAVVKPRLALTGGTLTLGEDKGSGSSLPDSLVPHATWEAEVDGQLCSVSTSFLLEGCLQVNPESGQGSIKMERKEWESAVTSFVAHRPVCGNCRKSFGAWLCVSSRVLCETCKCLLIR
ncbi:unnamed protein product, partial [Chrysoparadoxa australica]